MSKILINKSSNIVLNIITKPCQFVGQYQILNSSTLYF